MAHRSVLIRDTLAHICQTGSISAQARSTVYKRLYNIARVNREASPRALNLHEVLFAHYDTLTRVINDLYGGTDNYPRQDFESVIQDPRITSSQDLYARYLTIITQDMDTSSSEYKRLTDISTRLWHYRPLTTEIDAFDFATSETQGRLNDKLGEDIWRLTPMKDRMFSTLRKYSIPLWMSLTFAAMRSL